jgi:hypothetical protein
MSGRTDILDQPSQTKGSSGNRSNGGRQNGSPLVRGNLDANARIVMNALQPLIKAGKIRVPRGGYIIRRTKDRVIVERAE